MKCPVGQKRWSSYPSKGSGYKANLTTRKRRCKRRWEVR